jgi:large subunit ribosomal protein L5
MAERGKGARGREAGTAERPEPAAKQDGQASPQPGPPPRLKVRYAEEIRPALMSEFGYRNVMQVPRLEKVVVNIGIGEAIQNAKALDAAAGDLSAITGQKPIVKRARKSIAQFRLREGMAVGIMVTLRGDRMYEFLDRLLNAALPRLRDFRGLPTRSFDGRGNYSLGLREQLVFPEIDYDKIDKVRGMEITMVTTARTDQEARRLLDLFGVPFARA